MALVKCRRKHFRFRLGFVELLPKAFRLCPLVPMLKSKAPSTLAISKTIPIREKPWLATALHSVLIDTTISVADRCRGSRGCQSRHHRAVDKCVACRRRRLLGRVAAKNLVEVEICLPSLGADFQVLAW